MFRDAEALSEVIAIVLLIAIVITAAAGLFIAFQLFTGSDEPPDPIAFQTDQGLDRLTVTKAVPDANWAKVVVQVSAHGGPAISLYMGDADPYQNDRASFAGADLLAGPRIVSSTSAPVKTGDFIEFCADVQTNEVQITIIDQAANQQIAKVNFVNIRACA